MAKFQTRARAVDMLGRQQIAGVPTAISELFKNAHDAYADNAIVDYFRSDRLFVLRDDGIGMTVEDFEERWLTLATESKVGSNAEGLRASGRPGYPRREILGEKGIGRLAVAAIGPQALILSRPLRDGCLGDLLVSLVQWGLFEIPGANLDQIDIPTLTLPGSTLPTEEDVQTLLDWIEENLEGLADVPSVLAKRVRAEIAAFRTLDPAAVAAGLDGPSLATGPGTHFYIRPAEALITEDLVARERQEPSDLLKLLIGFTNTMTPGHAKPPMSVAFLDHWADEAYEDVIAETEFFTPEEFEASDHRLTGSFDDKGQFRGTVRVFDAEPVEIVIPYPSARGRPVVCGPFRIDVAYQQGEQRRTMLDPEAFGAINRKLRLYGGLYIYRDGIRVLPYGNPDVDFLEFEERRSRSASDYFFSYRRMFGVIEITRANNSELREKAGREGFAANDAYRQFREMLKNLFYEVAFRFFREAGAQSQAYHERRAELEKLEQARQRRARLVTTRRQQVSRGLMEFEQSLDDGVAEREAQRIVELVEAGLERAATTEDPGRAAAEVARLEDQARDELRKTNEAFRVDRPRGVALSRPLARRYTRYEDERVRLEENVLTPARDRIEELISRFVETHDLAIARQLRLEHAVTQAVSSARTETRFAQRELNTKANTTTKRAAELGRRHSSAVEDEISRARAELASLDVAACSNTSLVDFRRRLETELRARELAARESLGSVAAQLDAIVWPENGAGPGATVLDQLEAIETDLEILTEQASDQLELTQLGVAVEVINHEFRHSVQSIRRSLRQLRVWADANPRLRPAYNELKASFDHLDGYLALFTPLQRRLNRTKVEIAGSEIETFLRDLFQKRLSENGIRLTATPGFRLHRIESFPSSIYPVFVNLVDNAIFWLSGYQGDREIVLDAGKEWMAVRDTGPGLPVDLGDDIFLPRATTKPGGSGYGLFIARQVLEREGMALEAMPANPDTGAELRILEKPV
jgi:C4-dicarboxylate-specific signal transduction histidine kinase